MIHTITLLLSSSYTHSYAHSSTPPLLHSFTPSRNERNQVASANGRVELAIRREDHACRDKREVRRRLASRLMNPQYTPIGQDSSYLTPQTPHTFLYNLFIVLLRQVEKRLIKSERERLVLKVEAERLREALDDTNLGVGRLMTDNSDLSEKAAVAIAELEVILYVIIRPTYTYLSISSRYNASHKHTNPMTTLFIPLVKGNAC